MLPCIGLNYKRGLMELALDNELVDYSIKPFHLSSFPKLCDDDSLKDAVNNNFAKCAFRIKTLKNIMLTPLGELGSPNIDRIKGFAVDMFLIMQKQRRSLSDCVGTVYDFNNIINKIEYIIAGNKSQNFARSKNSMKSIKEFIYKSMNIFEQLIVFLNLAPKNAEKSDFVHYKVDNQIDATKSKCTFILEKIVIAKDLYHNIDTDFPLDAEVEKLQIIKNTIIKDIESMLDDSTLPFFNAVHELINFEDCVELDTPVNENYIKCIDIELDSIIHKILLSFQKLYKEYNTMPIIEKPLDDIEKTIEANLLSVKMYDDLIYDWATLDANKMLMKLKEILKSITDCEGIQFECIYSLSRTFPILKQYYLLLVYFVQQQLASHHATVNNLNIMLGAFITLSTKGFCIPPDLMYDQSENEESLQNGEGFGLEDGTGEKDASDKIESEDQLENAKKKDDHNNEEQNNCKEEKGIEMSDNFEAEQQDINKVENQEDDSGESDNDSELDKEMGETENDTEKLDDQIWGDDEEKEDTEKDLNDDVGKGSSKENDIHNEFDKQNEKSDNDNSEKNQRLDATESESLSDKEKKQNNVNNQIEDQSNNEEQSNEMHNNLEEPPEPENMELGEIDMNAEDDNQHDNIDENNPFDIGKLFFIVDKLLLLNFTK